MLEVGGTLVTYGGMSKGAQCPRAHGAIFACLVPFVTRAACATCGRAGCASDLALHFPRPHRQGLLAHGLDAARQRGAQGAPPPRAGAVCRRTFVCLAPLPRASTAAHRVAAGPHRLRRMHGAYSRLLRRLRRWRRWSRRLEAGRWRRPPCGRRRWRTRRRRWRRRLRGSIAAASCCCAAAEAGARRAHPGFCNHKRATAATACPAPSLRRGQGCAAAPRTRPCRELLPMLLRADER